MEGEYWKGRALGGGAYGGGWGGGVESLGKIGHRLSFESKDWCLVSTVLGVAWLCHY